MINANLRDQRSIGARDAKGRQHEAKDSPEYGHSHLGNNR